MPSVTLKVGGRNFDVMCDAGQEAHLERAAQILDVEASKLADNRLPESRLLLLTGLMLADKLTEAEQSARLRDQRIEKLEAQLAEGEAVSVDDGALKTAQEDARAAHDLLERVTSVLEEIAKRASAQAG
ncbi:cell division protein ZapA [Halovulum sp. GXIMD14793]